MNIALLTRRLWSIRCGGLGKPGSSSSYTISARSIASILRPSLTHIQCKKLLLPNKSRNLQLITFIRNLSKAAKRQPAKITNVRWQNIRALFSLAYPYRYRICVGLLLLLLGNSIGLILPKIIFTFVDIERDKESENASDEEGCLMMVAKYFKEHQFQLFGLFTFVAACYGLRHYCMHTAGQLVINNLRREVFRSMIRQDLNFFSHNKIGELSSRLSTDALIVGQSVSNNLTVGARAFMTFFGSASIMVLTSPELSQVIACLTAAIVTSGYFFGNFQRKYTLQMQEAVAASNELAIEKLSNIVTVRTLVSELRECNAYKKKIEVLWHVSRREGRAAGCMICMHELSILASLYAIVSYGGNLMNAGVLTYGDLLAFIWYASLCALSLPGIVSFYTDLMKGLGASARLFELRDRVPDVPIEGGIKIKEVRHGITFDEVCFGYAGRPVLFTSLSFHVPAGKVTAIVGPSGCGKSTLAHLVLRLQEPVNGRILVDDVDLNSIDPSHWRRMIGTVSQEPILFSSTIRDNIAYGAKDPRSITLKQMEDAAAQSNALFFIKSLPHKFDTLIGEHGTSMLSGGQKQRVAIARALINDPTMLILDEATSALDAASEDLVRRAIYDLLKNSCKTVLIIAHRLSTIKYADQIVVIDEGTIAETGTFEELMMIENGTFKKLIEKQGINYVYRSLDEHPK